MPQPDPSKPFAWNADDYSKSSPAQHLWAQELIAKLRLCGTETVLDIGCGDGRITAKIAGNLPKGSVVGIDYSPDMIRFALENFPQDRYRNLSFLQVDAVALPFAGEFDRVFSNATLHWIPDNQPVLAGIARSLRPTGRMLVQMGGKGNAADIFRAIDAVLEDPVWGPYFSGFSFMYGFFTPEEYREWMAGAGLETIRVELIPKDMTYPSRLEFAGFLRTTWLPWMERLPDGLRSRFVEDIIDKYLGMVPTGSDGIIHVRMVRMEAEGKKPGGM